MKPQSNKIYRLGDFLLNADRRLLRRGNAKVDFPNKPYQVLRYLVEHNGRMVSRAELLEQFWQGRDVYDETLTKCVGSIRKALDDRPDEPRFIETCYGVGYRYIGPIGVEDGEGGSPSAGHGGVRAHIAEPNGRSAKNSNGHIPVASGSASKGKFRRRPIIWIFACLLLTCLVSALTLYNRQLFPVGTLAATESRRASSVAVMPLRNLSNDPANDYLSEGITDGVVTALTRISGLKVIAVKDKKYSPQDVRSKLGVAIVLEGGVFESNDRIRIDIRLVDTENGHVIWAGDPAERDLKDASKIQDEIARNIAANLSSPPAGANERTLVKRHEGNLDAYQSYLKGRYFLAKRSPEAMNHALTNFQAAIRLDPEYALAYCGLADWYLTSIWFLRVSNADALQHAKDAATKALSLEPALPEAHISMANVFIDEWDIKASVRELKFAIESDPNNANARHTYAYALVMLGENDAAVEEIRRAQELDPLSVTTNIDVGEILLYSRRYEEAINALNHAIEMDPSRENAHWDLAEALERTGLESQAFKEYLKAEELKGETSESLIALNKAYNEGGIEGFWRKRLELANVKAKTDKVPAYIIAQLYARTGEIDAAYRCLDEVLRERSPYIVNLRIEPMFDSLRSDPRFEEMVRVGENSE